MDDNLLATLLSGSSGSSSGSGDLILQALLKDSTERKAKNPWIAGGKAALLADKPQFTNPWASGAAALGQSLLGGLMAGYGEQSAQAENDKLLQDYMKAATGENMEAELKANPGLEKYAQMVPLQKVLEQRALEKKINEKLALAEGEPPKIQDFYQGSQIVQKQWDPKAKAFNEVGRGARWRPKTSSSSGSATQVMTPQIRSQLIKETVGKAELTKGKEVIGGAYDAMKDVGTRATFNPFGIGSAKFGAAKAAIMSALQANWKGPMSDKDTARIEPLLPNRWDTTDRIAAKKEQMMLLLEANAIQTPLSDLMADQSGLGAGNMPKRLPGETIEQYTKRVSK